MSAFCAPGGNCDVAGLFTAVVVAESLDGGSELLWFSLISRISILIATMMLRYQQKTTRSGNSWAYNSTNGD